MRNLSNGEIVAKFANFYPEQPQFIMKADWEDTFQYSGPIAAPAAEYIQKDIHYRINYGMGIRGPRLEKKAKIVTLGCSHTLGYGLPEHHAWPRQIETITGKTVNNLGIAGSTIQLQTRIFMDYLRHFDKPSIVLANFPSTSRPELKSSDNGKTKNSDNPEREKEDIKKSLIALDTLETICRTAHIRLVWQIWEVSGYSPPGQIAPHGISAELDTFKLNDLYDCYMDNPDNQLFSAWYANHSFHMGDLIRRNKKDRPEFNYPTQLDSCCDDHPDRRDPRWIFAHDRYEVPERFQGDKAQRELTPKQLKELMNATPGKNAHPGIHQQHHWTQSFLPHVN